MYSRETLAETTANFHDDAMVPWLIKDALGLKGDPADRGAVQQAVLFTALKLAKYKHLPLIDKLAKLSLAGPNGPTTVGKVAEREIRQTKNLLQRCQGKGERCWLAILVEPASQKRKSQYRGIKAAYMLAVIGKPSTRQALVRALPKVTNSAVRFVVAGALDRLSPQGDRGLADQLEAIVQANVRSGDRNKIQADHPLKTVIARLRVRAE